MKKRWNMFPWVHMHANTFTHAHHTHSYNIYAILIGLKEILLNSIVKILGPEEGWFYSANFIYWPHLLNLNSTNKIFSRKTRKNLPFAIFIISSLIKSSPDNMNKKLRRCWKNLYIKIMKYIICRESEN